MADGSAKSHAMSLAYDGYGLSALDTPLVLQEFVNHGKYCAIKRLFRFLELSFRGTFCQRIYRDFLLGVGCLHTTRPMLGKFSVHRLEVVFEFE